MARPAIFTRDWWVDPPRPRDAERYSTLNPSGLATMFTSSYGSSSREPVLATYQSLAQQAYQGNAVVFGLISARAMLFSEAEFKFQDLTTRKLYGTDALSRLETPWPNGTTGELLVRMEQDVSLAGNAFVRDAGDQLERLRPDRVTIISEMVNAPNGTQFRRVIGYYYDTSLDDNEREPDFYPADEVVHWKPTPDPLANFRGMSWLTPVVREVTSDDQLTDYKISYLVNAATPNLLIKYDGKMKPETIESVGERMAARHAGSGNAFRTLVLDQGADASVVGSTFEQMNFATVQAAGENRIAVASGVPGIVAGLKEGLSAATYSNYEQAMRRFADLTMRPQWRSACGALSQIVAVPGGSKLWYDTSGIAALRQGEKERAETFSVKADAAGSLIRSGYTPESATAAVEAGDMSLLVHSGAVPVTLYQDGKDPANGGPGGTP